jgi:hypothetical protein
LKYNLKQKQLTSQILDFMCAFDKRYYTESGFGDLKNILNEKNAGKCLSSLENNPSTKLSVLSDSIASRINGLDVKLTEDTAKIENLVLNMENLSKSHKKLQNLIHFYDQLLN